MRRLFALVVVCVLSGAANAQPNRNFDHFTTGFRLDGAHLAVDCESCHVAGVFPGTPSECSGCHTQGGRVRASAPPASHPLTTRFCEDCHRTAAWLPITRMNHDAVSGACSTCHNNVQSVGKPPNHLATTSDCSACHRTTAWLPSRFDHTAVVGACSSCHNGAMATGKPATHFVTQLECDNCHLQTAWTPLVFHHSSATYPGDHGVPLTCADCHKSNAQTIVWPYPAYAPDCAACHAQQYRPGDHKNVAVTVNRDCGSCHRVTGRSFSR